MRCQRCRGLLVPESFGDLNIETHSLCMAIRCINCGCVEDAVMRANRFRSLVKTQMVPRRRVRKGGVVCNHVHT
jgi:RNase P subunit RPR2